MYKQPVYTDKQTRGARIMDGKNAKSTQQDIYRISMLDPYTVTTVSTGVKVIRVVDPRRFAILDGIQFKEF